MNNIIIFIYLELITAPMAILKWYCVQHWEKTTGVPEEKLKSLNKWEKIVTPIRYASRQENHVEIQSELMLKTGVYLEKEK